jgi:phage shock protein E
MHRYILFLCLCYAPVFAADITHTNVPLDQVKAATTTDTAILLDVREQNEWDVGHIKGALLVPTSRLSAKGATIPATIPKDKPIYLYCKAGVRALNMTKLLKEKGYDAHALSAGYSELVKAGFEKAN